MSLCIMLTILYFIYVINKLHMQNKTYVESGLEAMEILETLTSTDNGWTQKKNQVCTGKACLIDKHWKCRCLLGWAWMSPTLIVTMASACGIMSLLHPGSRYPCMLEISMYMHYLKYPCIMVYSCGACAQLSRQQDLHYEQIHYKWLCTKKPCRIAMVITWYYKLADFTTTKAFFY